MSLIVWGESGLCYLLSHCGILPDCDSFYEMPIAMCFTHAERGILGYNDQDMEDLNDGTEQKGVRASFGVTRY